MPLSALNICTQHYQCCAATAAARAMDYSLCICSTHITLSCIGEHYSIRCTTQHLRNLVGGRVARTALDFNSPLPSVGVVKAALAKVERRIAQTAKEAAAARTAVSNAVHSPLA